MGNLHISMGTTMSMILLFTQSSRIRRENVGSHAIVLNHVVYEFL